MDRVGNGVDLKKITSEGEISMPYKQIPMMRTGLQKIFGFPQQATGVLQPVSGGLSKTKKYKLKHTKKHNKKISFKKKIRNKKTLKNNK
jgi:hypothetical protein